MANFLLRLFIPWDWSDKVIDELEDDFRYVAKNQGITMAHLHYWAKALRELTPSNINAFRSMSIGDPDKPWPSPF